jgi:ankyrin repeat protein
MFMFNLKERKIMNLIENHQLDKAFQLMDSINYHYIDKNKNSFLIKLIQKNHDFNQILPIMEKLIGHNININQVNIYGTSAMKSALYKNLNDETKKIIQWLYDKGASFFSYKNSCDLFSLLESHEDTFFYLLDNYPLNINQKNAIHSSKDIGEPLYLGQTYLHEAMYLEKYNFAIKLLKKGANPTIPNKDSETVLDIAYENSEEVLKEIIINHYEEIKSEFNPQKTSLEWLYLNDIFQSMKEKLLFEQNVLPIVKKVKNKL